jgi:hypothetical protein
MPVNMLITNTNYLKIKYLIFNYLKMRVLWAKCNFDPIFFATFFKILSTVCKSVSYKIPFLRLVNIRSQIVNNFTKSTKKLHFGRNLLIFSTCFLNFNFESLFFQNGGGVPMAWIAAFWQPHIKFFFKIFFSKFRYVFNSSWIIFSKIFFIFLWWLEYGCGGILIVLIMYGDTIFCCNTWF